MPGYADTKKLIEDTLVNRPAGTVIVPEDHQTFALSLLDYIHAVELIGASSLQGTATTSTVPVQPANAKVSYISSVPPGQTYVYTNFRDENGDAISVTSSDNTVSLLTLLWNGSYWSVSVTPVTLVVDYSNGPMEHGSGQNSAQQIDSGAAATGDSSFAENSGKASGLLSHAEGRETTASGNGSHAEGQYNVSNKASTTFGNAGNTIHSVGIGTSNARKNAFEIMQNGDAYLLGIGGYDGTNPASAQTVQQVIADLLSRIQALENV